MDIKARINTIRATLPGHVTLVAVTKTLGDDALQAALDAGLSVFGENRVQEAKDHWDHRRAAYPDLELHLIGHLQTNKAAMAVTLFDVIETVDRARLVDALAAEMDKQNRRPACYIQVNTGLEPQKGGVAPEDLDALYHYGTGKGLRITGLMCIPPAEDDPAWHFTALAAHARRLALPHISMGMSGDYETAIACGATHIRLGSALFGARQGV